MRIRFTLFFIFFPFLTWAMPGQPPEHPELDLQKFKFVENKNQWDPAIRYRADLPGGYLFLKQNALLYAFYDEQAISSRHVAGQEVAALLSGNDEIQAHGVEVEFVGANPEVFLEAGGEGTERYNYLLGNNPAKWAAEARSFTNIAYHNLFPSIDMKLYTKQENLKYDFVVAPHGNPSLIRLHYKGASSVVLEHGNLKILTTVNTLVEQHPYSYQIINGKEVEVPSRFRLDGEVVQFEFPQGYNPEYELIIDPILVFSTYSGSKAGNWGTTATYDAAGNLYSGGMVFGADFPATIGAFRTFFSGGCDIAILKYNPVGTQLVYATFIGGTWAEVPSSLIVNSANQLVMIGPTGSQNFPITAGAFDNTFNGGTSVTIFSALGYPSGSDIFVTVLNAQGSNLVGSTYLGGEGNDGINIPNGSPLVRNYGDELRGEVILDAQDNIYLSSSTRSVGFPVRNAARGTMSGLQDGVVCKLNNNLTSLVWSTYLGGSLQDAAYSITLNSTSGDVYVVGGTQSVDFPVSPGAIKTSYSGGTLDGFISCYDRNGQWRGGSFLGTSAFDQSYFVDLDLQGSVYVLGLTAGNYTVTPGVYANPLGGQFIHKMRSDLTQTLWSTRVGGDRGTPDISPTAFMVSDCGHIYLTGWGGFVNTARGLPALSTLGLPTTPDALRRTTNGDDFYIMMLRREAASLMYGSFFGGTDLSNANEGDHVDGGTCRFDKQGVIYHSVCACRSNDFPTTPGAWSNVNPAAASGNCNNAAFKIKLEPMTVDFDIVSPQGNLLTVGCAPLQTMFQNKSTNALAYTWEVNGQVISNDINPSYVFSTAGQYTVKLSATNFPLCLGPTSVTKIIQVFPAVSATVLPKTICYGESTQLTASGGVTYSWTPATGLSNPNIASPVANPLQTTLYKVRVWGPGQICTNETEVLLTVLPEIKPSFTTQLTDACRVIPLVSLTNSSTGGSTYLWDFGNGKTSALAQPPPFRYEREGTYTIRLTVSNEQKCSRTLEKTVTVKFNPGGIGDLVISPDQKICAGEPVQLSATGGTSYSWTPAAGLSDAALPNPVATPSVTTRYKVRITSSANCVVDTSVLVEVKPAPVIDFEVKQLDSCSLFPMVKIINRSAGAKSYTWTLGDGQTFTGYEPPVFRYSSEGNYTITLSAQSEECLRSVSKPVDFVKNPESDFRKFVKIPGEQKICVGESVQLAVTGGRRYVWTPATGLSNPNIADPVASPTMTTKYNVRIFNLAGCWMDTSITVNVSPRVSADFEVRLEELCEPYPLVRIISKADGGESYLWDFGNGTTYSGVQPPPFKYSSDGNFTIKLTAQNTNCKRTFEVTVPMQYELSADFYKSIRMPPNQVVCAGTGVPLTITSGKAVRFEWTPATGLSNPNIANPVATPLVTTRYNVRISNQRGCSVDSSVLVEVVPDVVPDFEVVMSAECGKQGTLRFVNKSTGTNQFKWVIGNKKDTLYTATPQEQAFAESGTYEIVLEAFNQVCSRTKKISVPVETVMPPNVITPNGDEKNERFEISVIRQGWKLEIYDRSGKQVFKSANYLNSWGSEAPSGTYYYHLTSPEGKTCRGWVQVLRGTW